MALGAMETDVPSHLGEATFYVSCRAGGPAVVGQGGALVKPSQWRCGLALSAARRGARGVALASMQRRPLPRPPRCA